LWLAVAPSRGPSNYKDPLVEPDDHGLGRSRGALTSKLHALVDGHGLLLVLAVTPGRAGDSPVLPVLLEHLAVCRAGPGRPRSRPDALLADKAHSARGHRRLLRAAGVQAVIPEPSDQQQHRRNRGRRGGRPPAFDSDLYKRRNVIERGTARRVRDYLLARWAS
jgi:transposase